MKDIDTNFFYKSFVIQYINSLNIGLKGELI